METTVLPSINQQWLIFSCEIHTDGGETSNFHQPSGNLLLLGFIPWKGSS